MPSLLSIVARSKFPKGQKTLQPPSGDHSSSRLRGGRSRFGLGFDSHLHRSTATLYPRLTEVKQNKPVMELKHPMP